MKELKLQSPEKNYLLQKKALASLTDAQRMALTLWAEGANEGEISLILCVKRILVGASGVHPVSPAKIKSFINDTITALRAEVKK